MDTLARKENQPVNLDEVVGNFTMDCVGRICFSADFKTTANGGSEMMNKTAAMVAPWRIYLTSMAPNLCYYLNIGMQTGNVRAKAKKKHVVNCWTALASIVLWPNF